MSTCNLSFSTEDGKVLGMTTIVQPDNEMMIRSVNKSIIMDAPREGEKHRRWFQNEEGEPVILDFNEVPKWLQVGRKYRITIN